MNIRKISEHTGWTFVESFLVVMLGTAVFDWNVELLQAAAASGLFSVAFLVKQIAEFRREKLAQHLPYIDDYEFDEYELEDDEG